jgi:flagellar hook-associated protein 2
MSVATISGAVSGLDTATLINSLVSVQQNQQVLLRQQQAAVQKRSTALTSLSSSLTTLSTQAADLAKTAAWTGATATSSSSGVTATATGVKAASLTFDVTAVAAAHTLISSDALNSTSAQAASGALTLTRSDGTTASIDVGSGSLADVVAGINQSSTGLVAAAVQTGPGAYRLQVASASTGSTSSFTLEGLTGFTTMNVLTEGADATLHLGGTSAAAYDVTSSSNTFASLIPGLSFTVSKPETGVTVASTVDGSAVATKVNSLVTTANSILSSIATNTAYNASTKTSGPLTGDSAVRELQQNILSIVSSVDAPGVEVTRDGQVTFDQQAFLTAFKADPAKVASAFGASGTFTAASGVTGSSASVSSALKMSRAGTYAVHVDTAPQRESWQIDPSGSDLSGQTIQLARGDTTVSYTVGAGQTLDQTATAFNAVSASARFGVTARVVDSTLQFSAEALGASAAFTTSLDGVEGTRLTAGTDITGSIDGQTATGVGGSLSLPSGTGGAVGLTLSVTTTQDDVSVSGGAIGTLAYRPGLAQRLVTLVNDATDSQIGSLTTAQTGATAEIKRYQQDIDAWDTRLTAYRASLTQQFTAMETALASLKTQSNAISGLLSSSSSSSSSGSSSSGTLSSG